MPHMKRKYNHVMSIIQRLVLFMRIEVVAHPQMGAFFILFIAIL
jgi:hypothetical protein